MGDLAQGHIVIAARGQGGDEPGQAGHIADCTWYFGTVKVGTETDTVDAKTFNQVVNVAHHRVKWRVLLVMTILA